MSRRTLIRFAPLALSMPAFLLLQTDIADRSTAIALALLVFGVAYLGRDIACCVFLRKGALHEYCTEVTRLVTLAVRLMQATLFFLLLLGAWSVGSTLTGAHSFAAALLTYVTFTTVQGHEWGLIRVKRGALAVKDGGATHAVSGSRTIIIIEEVFTRR